MSDVDEELQQIEQELAAVQSRLQTARRNKAMSLLAQLDEAVEALGDLVDLHEQLDDEGREKIRKLHARLGERFAAMGLTSGPDATKRKNVARPVMELQPSG